MKIIKHTTEFQIAEETAVSLGKFDGLHQGHRLLIDRILKKKEEGLASLIFTFDFGARPALTLPTERRAILLRDHMDYLVECPFVPALSHMEPEAFVRKVLMEGLHARYLAVGTDFRFGYQRKGDYRLLKQMSDECNFRVDVVERCSTAGRLGEP